MALDLIKEYLIGIGFNVNQSSLNQAEKSISDADKTIQDFNKNSTKGFSESNDSLNAFFQLIKSSSGTLEKLFPGLKTPFNSFIKDISLVKKLYADLNKEIEKSQSKPRTQPSSENEHIPNTDTNNTGNSSNNRDTNLPSIIQNNKELSNSSINLIEQILNARNASKSLLSEGGSAFKLFSSGAVASIGAITISISALVLAGKGLTKFLNELAAQDIEYEKLSRQLWTTKENAKEVDMAMKTLGVSMQDLWLSPTLLKQFNKLRQDSAALKLPKEYTDNLKIIQDIGLEFKRLRQLGQLAMQWIGNYILKYAAEPLSEIRQEFRELNNWIVQNLPGIGKFIGSIVGLLVRVGLEIGKIIGILFKLTSPIFAIIRLFDKLPESVKEFGKFAILAASPFLLILGLIDDIITALEGGKSVIGSTFSGFKTKANSSLSSIQKKFASVRDNMKNGINSIKSSWDYYWDKARSTFDKLEDKAKNSLQKIKEKLNAY